MVIIPSRLLKIEELKSPAAFLTSRYLGDNFFSTSEYYPVFLKNLTPLIRGLLFIGILLIAAYPIKLIYDKLKNN